METTKTLGGSLAPYENTLQIPGPDGLITIPEKVVQEIWHQKNFAQSGLRTTCGKKIRIIHPGKWNFQEGPDFLSATIAINDKTLCGDVEIHFHPEDWGQHGHAEDPNFNNVILHVSLFPPKREGPQNPTLMVLLEYLTQSVDEYAEESALLHLEDRTLPGPMVALAELPFDEKLTTLRNHARKRWIRKCQYAHKRIDRHGWEVACHQRLMEVLGYKRNRVPMAEIALAYPINELKGMTVEDLYETQEDNWKLAGLRPANHPKKRIEQYLTLVNLNPDWPTDWLDYARRIPNLKSTQSTSKYRKINELSKIKKAISENILHKTISGTRFETVLIDALLPLASAELGRDLFDLWFHWHAGDMPENVQAFLKHANILSREQPLCNGLAQGTLQHFITFLQG